MQRRNHGAEDRAIRAIMKKKSNIASLVNMLQFGGRQVVKPRDVTEVSGTAMIPDETEGEAKFHELIRDHLSIVRRCRDTIVDFFLFGVEAQSAVDKYMPIRAFIYDAATYYNFLKSKEGRPLPVVTYILYLGKTPWTGSRTLSEALELSKETLEELGDDFHDYKLNIISLYHLTNDEIKKLSGEFQTLACMCTYLNGERYEVHDTLNTRFGEAVRLAKQLNLKLPQEFLDQHDSQEKISMRNFLSPVIDDIKLQGAREAEDRIREDAVREAEGEIRRATRLQTQLETIKNMLSGGLSLEKICSLMKISNDELREIRAFAPAAF